MLELDLQSAFITIVQHISLEPFIFTSVDSMVLAPNVASFALVVLLGLSCPQQATFWDHLLWLARGAFVSHLLLLLKSATGLAICWPQVLLEFRSSSPCASMMRRSP